RNIERNDELPSEETAASISSTGDWHGKTNTTSTGVDEIEVEEQTQVIVAGLVRKGEEPDTGTGRVRALVIDHDPPNRYQMVARPEQLGYECPAAASGAQALELLGSLYFDLVFADVATPELDGLKLCRAIKRSKRLARSKVIVTTSVVDSGQIADEELQ